MGTISLSLPSDGQTIDASDVNNPFNTIANEINGNLSNANIAPNAAIDRSKISGFTDGWESLGYTPSTVTCNGNRSYDLTFSSVDLTGNISKGMRLKLTRTVTAPTQCADLESGSSQYFSKSSPSGSFGTTTLTASAWVKLESYTLGYIISRYDGTNGWGLRVDATGQITLFGIGGGAGADSIQSYQSIPLGKWVHVAGSLTMSTGGNIYIDGVDCPALFTNGASTTIGAVGNLQVGAANSISYFDGKIAQAAIYSTIVSAATIRASMSQTLSGSETGLVSAFSLNGVLTDLNANANTLTGSGGALATATDTPFTNPVTNTSITAGITNYAIITAASFSTNTTLTVQVPEGDTLPTSGGISAISYSTQKIPYGFPIQRGKWRIESIYNTQTSAAASATTAYNTMGAAITLPIGEYSLWYRGIFYVVKSASATSGQTFSLISATAANATPIGRNFVNESYHNATGSTQVDFMDLHYAEGSYTASAQTTLYVNTYTELSLAALGWYAASLIPDSSLVIAADNAYL